MAPSASDGFADQIQSILRLKAVLEQAQEEAEADYAAALNEQNAEGLEPATKITAPSVSAHMATAPAPTPPRVATEPSKEHTGVDPYVTSICATISLQIYKATTKEDFNLKNDKDNKTGTAEVIVFDNHGILHNLVPPFAVAVSGDIMILAWRGSSTIMDWASDFSASPVASSRWSHVAPYVKAHSGYVSLVESDLGTHEHKLVKEIRSRKIKHIVTTGHSLAGGMALVSHVFLEGQLQKKGSPWNKLRGSQWKTLRGKLTVRSIAFAAPMTIMNTMDLAKPDEPTTTFLKKISEHSCNIVYGLDVVPHACGDTAYLINVIEAVVKDGSLVAQWSWVLRIFPCIVGKLLDMIKKFQKDHWELLQVMSKYNHIGKIIHYADLNATPVPLSDESFRGYVEVPKKSRGLSTELAKAHNYFPEALAYNLPEVKPGTNVANGITAGQPVSSLDLIAAENQPLSCRRLLPAEMATCSTIMEFEPAVRPQNDLPSALLEDEQPLTVLENEQPPVTVDIQLERLRTEVAALRNQIVANHEALQNQIDTGLQTANERFTIIENTMATQTDLLTVIRRELTVRPHRNDVEDHDILNREEN